MLCFFSADQTQLAVLKILHSTTSNFQAVKSGGKKKRDSDSLEASSRSWFERYFTLRLSISTQWTIIYRCCAIYERKKCMCVCFVLCTERPWIPITRAASYSVAGGMVATVLHQNVTVSFLPVEETKSNFRSIEHRHPLAGVTVVKPERPRTIICLL